MEMKITDNYTLDVVSVRLVQDAPILSHESLHTPEAVYRAIGKELEQFDREVVAVINMKTDMQPINMSVVSIGTLNMSIVHPREIFKAACLSNAEGIVLVHNHPSGNITPSKSDVTITSKLQMACNIMDIRLLDHIIVGKGMYYSFAEHDILPYQQPVYADKAEDIQFKVADKRR